MGKSVVLIEPSKYLGGLTTGGLGATDIGNKQVIGGLSRDFYRHVKKYYVPDSFWNREKREDYKSRNPHFSESDDAMWTFEPHVASFIYTQMLQEKHDKLALLLGERLDRQHGVEKNGTRIESITMEYGPQNDSPHVHRRDVRGRSHGGGWRVVSCRSRSELRVRRKAQRRRT